MYNPPDFETAMFLLNEIIKFLKDCGGHYREEIPEWLLEHIAIGLITGQYKYEEGRYFVTWWKITEEGLQQTKEHIRPDNLTDGNLCYIVECGCKTKEDMNEIRRFMRQQVTKGVHWHRAKKGWQHFTRQEGSHGK